MIFDHLFITRVINKYYKVWKCQAKLILTKVVMLWRISGISQERLHLKQVKITWKPMMMTHDMWHKIWYHLSTYIRSTWNSGFMTTSLNALTASLTTTGDWIRSEYPRTKTFFGSLIPKKNRPPLRHLWCILLIWASEAIASASRNVATLGNVWKS